MADVAKINITPQLVRAVASRDIWNPDRARTLATSLTEAIPDASLDWDEDAGEEWARILVGQFVVALIRVRVPLAIVLRREAMRLKQLDPEIVMIAIDDMESPWMTAAEDWVARAFPEREISTILDIAAFSAMDLWFATT